METKTFSALAEPTRFKIVGLLMTQPRSVNQVASLLGIRQPQASKHLATLYEAGLVSNYPVAQQRIYALNPEPFTQMEVWLGEIRRSWGERLQRLDGYLETLTKG